MEKNTHSLHGKSVRFSSFPSSDGWSFQIIQQDMGVQADHSHVVRVQLQFLLMLRPQRPLPVFILCAFPFLTDAVDCRGAALVPVFKVQGYPVAGLHGKGYSFPRFCSGCSQSMSSFRRSVSSSLDSTVPRRDRPESFSLLSRLCDAHSGRTSRQVKIRSPFRLLHVLPQMVSSLP